MKKIDKPAMLEDIFLSIACILSVIIMYFFSSITKLFNTHTAVDYVTYSICIIVVAKILFHIIKLIYEKIKNNRKY